MKMRGFDKNKSIKGIYMFKLKTLCLIVTLVVCGETFAMTQSSNIYSGEHQVSTENAVAKVGFDALQNV